MIRTSPTEHAPLLLVVCTGNICRSPLLERLLQQRLDAERGEGAVRVRSAGTAALAGHAMDERSAELLRRAGGEPGDFTARQLTGAMVAEASLVLTATRDHRSHVVRLDPRALRHTFTVRELAVLLEQVPDQDLPRWGSAQEALQQVAVRARSARAALLSSAPADLDIVDPYRQNDAVYERMEAQVQKALIQIGRVVVGAPATT